MALLKSMMSKSVRKSTVSQLGITTFMLLFCCLVFSPSETNSQSCCPSLTHSVHSLSSCCFEFTVDFDGPGVCEITAVRLTILTPGVTMASVRPGSKMRTCTGGAGTSFVVFCTDTGWALNQLTYHMGDFCLSSTGTTTIRLEYYDANTGTYICTQNFQVSC